MKKLVLYLIAPCLLAIVVATDHYSLLRLGTNSTETSLTPTSFSSNFGKLCSYTTDGAVYSQPLYIPAVSGVTGQSGPVNLLVVSTMNGSVYAFNADACGAAIWTRNFGAVQAASSYPGTLGGLIYNRQLGCKGTPAVDTTTNVVYFVCSTATTWVLRRVALVSGQDYPVPPSPGNSSITITGTVNAVTFCPLCQQNSAGVTITQGHVYVSFGSMNDQTNHGNWYGWIFAYSTGDMSQTAVLCTTCSNASGGGGVWQAGGGLSVDASGNIYAITGNGSSTPGAGNYTMCLLKLDTSLNVLDWYAPSDYANMNTNDQDLASGRPMLIPGTDLVVFGAKDFNVYSVHSSCLGNIGGTQNGCTAPQVFITQGGITTTHDGIYGCLYVPGLHVGFFPNTSRHIYAFTLTGSTWNTTPSVISSANYEFPGAQMTASCNGSTNCIVWATAPLAAGGQFTAQQAKLVALNPSDLTEYWSSTTRTTDAVGTLAKLTIPTVANGKVYVGTLDNSVVSYGLSPTRIILAN